MNQSHKITKGVGVTQQIITSLGDESNKVAPYIIVITYMHHQGRSKTANNNEILLMDGNNLK